MKKNFNVEGMSCAACQSHVEKATKSVNGVVSCQVNLLSNSMTVETNDTYVTGSIEKAVENAGYKAFEGNLNKNEITINKEKKDYKLVKLIVSAIFLILLMYISMGNMMLGWPLPSFMSCEGNKMGFALAQFILVLPICYIYRNYFINGFKMLLKRNPNMDSLIALGAVASLAYGIFSLFMISYGYYLLSVNDNSGAAIIKSYHMNLYFESAGMILVLVSLGKYLEGLSKKKTTEAVEDLIKLKPETAVVYKDGNEILTKIEDVKKGDIISVKVGMQIPVDGKVIFGTGSVNEANMTGESVPSFKEDGSNVYSSTILESGYIRVEASKVGADTSFSKIIELVSEASNSKAPISKLADRISRVFVPIVILISLLTFTANMLALGLCANTEFFELSLNFAITVLVIACPCALGLATPVAIMVGTGVGAKNGLLIKNAEILENTSKIDTIVFDKTGTLTVGRPEIIDFISYNDEAKSILYSLEAQSAHPLAGAIVNGIEDATKLDVTSINMTDGVGLDGFINGKHYFAGNKRLFDILNINDKDKKELINKLEGDGKTVVVLISKTEILAITSLVDKPKNNSLELITDLKSLGIKTVLLTGDNKKTASVIADKLKLDTVYSEVLPEDKGRIIDEIKSRANGLVAMVGDGVNDAIALAKADIAISLTNASDVAINTSDVILAHNNIYDIYNVIKLSKRTMNTIKLCLFWAFFYNFICVILATGFLYYVNGFKMMPMYGAIAMSISSVSVVLTALSISLFKPNGVIKQLDENIQEISVKGMMCNNCVEHVEEACMSTPHVVYAKADLKKKSVVIKYEEGIILDDAVNSIVKEGYKAKIKHSR